MDTPWARLGGIPTHHQHPPQLSSYSCAAQEVRGSLHDCGTTSEMVFQPAAEGSRSFLAQAVGPPKKREDYGCCLMCADHPGQLARQPPPPSSHQSLLPGLSLATQSPCGAANTPQLTKGPVASLIEELVSRRPQQRYFQLQWYSLIFFQDVLFRFSSPFFLIGSGKKRISPFRFICSL